jgi:hypothetical protein
LRLDEWQRYIDSEFLEERSDRARPLGPSGAPRTPPNAQADSGAEIAPLPDRHLEGDESSGAESPGDAPRGEPRESPGPADRPHGEIGEGLEQEAPAANGAAPESAETEGPRKGGPAPTAMETAGPQAGALIAPARSPDSPEPATNGSSDATAARAGSAALDIEIAPFADYISRRRGGDGPAPTLELEYDASHDLTGADADATAPVAAPVERTILTPLVPTAETLARLRGLAADRAAGSEGRESLLRQMCDPLLSVDEAALLLGTTPGALRRRAEQGAPPYADSAAESGPAGQKSGRGATRRKFRLSDILALLATN